LVLCLDTNKAKLPNFIYQNSQQSAHFILTQLVDALGLKKNGQNRKFHVECNDSVK